MLLHYYEVTIHYKNQIRPFRPKRLDWFRKLSWRKFWSPHYFWDSDRLWKTRNPLSICIKEWVFWRHSSMSSFKLHVSPKLSVRISSTNWWSNGLEELIEQKDPTCKSCPPFPLTWLVLRGQKLECAWKFCKKKIRKNMPRTHMYKEKTAQLTGGGGGL